MSATSSSEAVTEQTSRNEPASSAEQAESAPAKAPRRAVRRPSKPDALLAAAVETARAGLLEVVPAEQIGTYAGAFPDAERLVTHRFEALRPGYNGWQWYATVARVPRGKVATVCEVGLLPSENAVLAPEWVPWSDRLRPEDVAAEEAAQAQERAAALAEAGDNHSGNDGAPDNHSGNDDTNDDGGAEPPAGRDKAGTREDY
ncbi:DUF3027 domain-containing protein [Arthrobacter sp. zg-Y1219]|uniref:DUF3027 domain-containing protein n=1 Tax=Arthrobacter sp. zg-Y1219 TaxID=3049067 RepID=UPI0024C2114A|nr:DUF3027 domain-containing protein [Arthrobacter sp. zg-Y1219]MDK1361820.1 DUF3027 domain-containing protein [Arthrobacter sp. zg-Y1219]